MKRLNFIIILFVFIFVSFGHGVQSFAQDALPGNADGTIGTGDGTTTGCDWNGYLDVLADQENLPQNHCGANPSPECKNRQYITVRDGPNPLNNGSRDASWGRYQFIPATWAAMVRSEYPQCVRAGYESVQTLPGGIGTTKNPPYLPNAISQTCWPVQDYAAIKFTNGNLEWANQNDWCGMLGTTVTGKHVGAGHPTLTCTVTKSGMLSAFHNAGRTCSRLKAAGTTGSHLRSRMCKAGGIPIPEDCNPEAPANVSEDVIEPTESMPAPTDYIPKDHFYTVGQLLKYNVVAAFQNMTTELTTFMMQQVNMVGQFFDAKHQLETQRLLQEKTAQAHKDYHPSTQMCMIGTFARNLIDSSRRSDLTKTALTQSMIDRALATGDSQTSDIGLDSATRRRALIDRFCNKTDNAQQNRALCKGDIDPDDVNADINYTRTIDAPLTLDIDPLDGTENKDEETIFAFLDYIFMHEKFPYKTKSSTVLFQFIEPYMDMRSTIAIRSVAQNSFAEIIAQKTAGTNGEGESVGPFMKALLRDFGIEDNAIENMIGENPSYYAQMEILTKTIYQHPEFISNLYDKPANVKRIRAALTAIKLMQDRDIHDALMRREMLMSMLLELQLRQKQQELINLKIKGLNSRPAGSADQTAPNAPTATADPADSGF